jgi:hypothetical protein
MATNTAQVYSPLCALIVEGDPSTHLQGGSNACIGTTLILAELGIPFEVVGYIRKDPSEEDEVRVLVEKVLGPLCWKLANLG